MFITVETDLGAILYINTSHIRYFSNATDESRSADTGAKAFISLSDDRFFFVKNSIASIVNQMQSLMID